MNRVSDQTEARRRFLRMLAASPLLSGSFIGSSLRDLLPSLVLQQADEVILSPDQAFNVMDFEAAARKALPPAHFGYLATGVDEDNTVRANREGYSRVEIRPRRL